MLKILAACGNSMGTSRIIKMRIEHVLKDMGLEFKVDHASVELTKGLAKDYDIVLVAQQLVTEFINIPETYKVIGIVNLLNAQEIEEKIKAALNL